MKALANPSDLDPVVELLNKVRDHNPTTPAFNAQTGEVFEPSKGLVVGILEAATALAERALEAAKQKHGTDDLANFRDEWELHRRLRGFLGRHYEQ